MHLRDEFFLYYKHNNIKINKMDSNSVILKNLLNIEQNMMKLLDEDSTLCYKNCNNLKISIDSKINKIEFDNCKKIEISLKGLVSGIDVLNSESVQIDNSKNKPLNTINIAGSKGVKVLTSKKVHNNTSYNIDNSYDIVVEDHSKRSFRL